MFLLKYVYYIVVLNIELFNRFLGSFCFNGEYIENYIFFYLLMGLFDYGFCLVKKIVLYIWFLLEFGEEIVYSMFCFVLIDLVFLMVFISSVRDKYFLVVL